MTSGTYVEDQNLIIPALDGGVTSLGDLWDCIQSKYVGENLFKQNLDGKYIKATPIESFDYRLIHSKSSSDGIKLVNVGGEVLLELLAGLIKVKGYADNESYKKDNTRREQLICHYRRETYSIEALPDSKSILDEFVVKKLMGKELKATHFVHGITLGAEVKADILVTQNDSNDKSDIKGDVFGKLVYGPINASVKAKLGFLDSEDNKDFNKEINVYSMPYMKSEPKTVEEMFKMIEGVDAVVEKQKHFPEYGDKVVGVPIRFVLVPIKQFFDVEIENLYLKLSDKVLKDFNEMLVKVQDIQVSGYIMRKVHKNNTSLSILLNDSHSNLSLAINKYENDLRNIGIKYFEESIKTLKLYKGQEASVENLFQILNRFETECNSSNELEKIGEFVELGEIDLRSFSAVNIKDSMKDGHDGRIEPGFDPSDQKNSQKPVVRSKRADPAPSEQSSQEDDGQTLEEETQKGNYHYWLQQHDIADIARVEYHYGMEGSSTLFETVGSPQQLSHQLDQFHMKVSQDSETRPLTLIVNLENIHWVTLVIAYRSRQFYGYYVDSLGHKMPNDIHQALKEAQVTSIDFHNFFLTAQQKDGHNCGLRALENAVDLNRMLQENQSLDWGVTQLKRRRDEVHFTERRKYFAETLSKDETRTLLNRGQEKCKTINVLNVVGNMGEAHSIQGNVEVTGVKLTQHILLPPAERLPERWKVPLRNHNFIGRSEMLEQIAKHFSQESTPVILTAHGSGGIGKTQLALEFAWQHYQEYTGVVWFNAENQGRLQEDYISLGRELNIIRDEENIIRDWIVEKISAEEQARCVKHWLEHPSRANWLLVYDNVPNFASIKDLLPSVKGGKVLVTSCYTEGWPQETVEVNMFTLEEAIAYIQKVLGDEASNIEQVKRLGETLGRLPLALAQASAYIKQSKRVNIERYLELYEQKKREVLDSKILPADYPVSVYVTWDITMEVIRNESPLAVKLLSNCACLASRDIPDFLLKFMATPPGNNPTSQIFEFENALDILNNYSMLTSDEQSRTSLIHTLVQEVIRLKWGAEEKMRNLVATGKLLVDSYPYGRETLEAYAQIRQLLPHLEAFLPHLEAWQQVLLSKASMELGQTIEKGLLINFLFLMADGYRVLGNAQKRRDLFERASPLLERYYGPHHPKVALNLMSLSAAYVALGDAKKARDLLERALPILENHYGSDHPEAARTLTNMGVAYVASDHTEKAHELLERALTIGERYYGPNHPKVTKTLQALHRLKILEHTQETVPQSSAQQPHRLMEELFNAARQGDLQKIRDCISKGAKVNAQNAGYKTALHIAAEKGYVNIIRTLLEKGANSGVREIIGWTPLHMAAANGHLEVVNALLENNADPTIKDKEEKTPLNLAEERKNKVELPGILEEVKNYQEIINSLSKRVNELEQVQKDLFNFLKKSSSELTALQKKKAYQIARIESYLKKGARINTIDSNHRTVLHFAAKNGRLEVVNVILENGADPTIKDKEEKTPLDLVVEQKNKVEQSGMLEEVKNYQEIIDVLSEKINKLEKSKLKSQDELFNAVKQGDLQKVRDCLRKGTNVNAKNTAHETPLHIAAEKSYKDIVQTLLENGANIEEQDIIAWTPLHLAAANGHLEIVNTLLKRITDRYQFIKLNAGDNKVASPLQLAAQKHHLQIVNVLLTKGASLGVVPRVDNDALLRLREWRTKFSKKMSKCRTPYS